MRSTIQFRLLAVLVLALAGTALAVTQAGAHGGGKGARIDTDRDGASNRCEAQAGTDKTVADTDGNGTIDGLEDSDSDGANNAAESRLRSNCGRANTRFKIRGATVVSYADDKLTLKIGKRGLLTAPVSSSLVCEQPDNSEDEDDVASTSRRGGDDGPGDDRRGRGRGDDDRGEHRRGRGDDDDTVACTTADLTEGTEIRKAKVKGGAFTKIRLAGEFD